ncbi:MAG: dockerin type I domain-containing protein, partial [Desulfobacterales bacterium]|nr:dockerin type I domain-containing protein [Desulfobacterales bacterium]
TGDANYDGKVNDLDVTIVANNWRNTGTDWATGDFNADGVTDSIDLFLLSQAWVDTSDTGTGGGGIPEPASLSILLLGGGAILRRRIK